MKVAILIEKIEHGGIQSIGYGLAELFKDESNEAVIVHGLTRIDQFAEGLEKHDLGRMLIPVLGVHILSPRFLIKYHRFIRRYKPDILHSMGFPMGVLGGILSFKKVPIVVTSQTRVRRGKKGFNEWIIKHFVDKVILTSDYHRDIFPLDVAEEKLVSIPNLIKAGDMALKDNHTKAELRQSINIGEDRLMLLSVSRLTKGKRLDIFLKVIKKLSANNDKVLGVIVGNGPAKEQLIEMAKSLEVEDHLIFTGGVDDLSPYFHSAEILVHTSEAEIQPMILIEACAIGLPVVCSDIGGNRTVIQDGYNGMVAGNENPDEFADCIAKIANDDELRNELSSNGKKMVEENHSQRVIKASYMELYQSLQKH